ncbi:hypothetical protein [Acidihalobacter ferrooxydans]|uniref:hypothetical protein n=1 Tax=Acidihalobacter ferrooxydans TaxID=1765967 RepID=UPI0012EBB0E4|nr:hypothetical protein [Acidihalobacter ferrooxydans]
MKKGSILSMFKTNAGNDAIDLLGPALATAPPFGEAAASLDLNQVVSNAELLKSALNDYQHRLDRLNKLNTDNVASKSSLITLGRYLSAHQ